jgi:hypothetical protein
VDLSALIFVALAIAWAAYLIPKALKHHEVDRVTRSVDSFSDRMRVLARREPAPAPVRERARKRTPGSAARRRRRVLGTILLANLVVVGLGIAGVIGWVWEAIPATLLVAWLVACRLMVRKERAVRNRTTPVRKRRTTLADEVIAEEDAALDTDEIPVVPADKEPAAGGWDPVPVTLPTYVAKATAGRTVRTIDLDSTGVWSSGRNVADSALAREADERRADQAEPEQRRVSGA